MLPAATGQTNTVQWMAQPEDWMAGYWFTIQPSDNALEHLKFLSEFVQNKLRSEGITHWKPYPKELMHLSLFLGFNSATTNHEKRLLVQKVSEKIANFPAYKIDVLFKNALLRRTGRWVTLQFDSDATTRLNGLVKEALKESIHAVQFNPEHLYVRTEAERAQNPLGGLEKLFFSHISLGAIELEDNPDWNLKHRDLRTLVNSKLTQEMQQAFLQRFGNQMCSFEVNSIHLTGMAKETIRIEDKRNITIAIIKIGNKPNPQSVHAIPPVSLTRVTQLPSIDSDFWDHGSILHSPTCKEANKFYSEKYCGGCAQCIHYVGCKLLTFEQRKATQDSIDKKDGFCSSCTIRIKGREEPEEKANRFSALFTQ